MKPFREGGEEDVSENENNDFVLSNASMKRRKKVDPTNFDGTYSDSGVMSKRSSTKKGSNDNNKKHFFKSSSKQPKKKEDETDVPSKIVPLTMAASSSISENMKWFLCQFK